MSIHKWAPNVWFESLFGGSSSFWSNQNANIALIMYIPTAILIHISLRNAISSVVSDFVASRLSKWKCSDLGSVCICPHEHLCYSINCIPDSPIGEEGSVGFKCIRHNISSLHMWETNYTVDKIPMTPPPLNIYQEGGTLPKQWILRDSLD